MSWQRRENMTRIHAPGHPGETRDDRRITLRATMTSCGQLGRGRNVEISWKLPDRLGEPLGFFQMAVEQW